MLRLAALALAGAAALALPAAASHSAAPERAALALLVDGRLVRIGLASGSVRVGRVEPLRRTIQSGPLLAVEPGRRTVYALIRSEVVALDARTLAVKRRFRLPAGTVYRGLALGPVSGRLYVSGNRAVRVLDRATGLAEEDATLTILDPRSGAVLGWRVAREAAGRSWFVYWISLAPDERHVALAYHGGCGGRWDTCTTGVDVLPVDRASVRRCVPVEPQFPSTACTPDVHGAAVPWRDGFLAATGGPPLVLVDRAGRVVRRLTTGMSTHLMDLAVDAAARTAYAVGPCDKGGGLRAIALDSGTVRRLRTARGPRAICGSRVAVASGSVLVVPTGRSIALLSRILPAVLVVDARSGRTTRRVRVGARIVDVAVA
jgi:hypothetical protein